MTAARLVVLASGRGTNFTAIAEACRNGSLAAVVVGVLSNVEGAPVLDRAVERGIPAVTVPSRGVARHEHEQPVLAQLASWDPDLVVLAGYMRILSEAFVQRFAVPGRQHGRIVNVHPAPTDEYKGPDGYGWAIATGRTQTAVTVHWVDAGLDTGPVILQQPLPVLPGDTVESLRDRGLRVEHELYPSAIALAIRQLQETR